jgi:hypothetical protein
VREGSCDILHVNLTEPLSPEMQEMLDEMVAHLEILRPDTQLQLRRSAVPDSDYARRAEVDAREVPPRTCCLDLARADEQVVAEVVCDLTVT